jgi:hypothetical protein
MKNKPKHCPVCDQKMDIYTKAHKNSPFVDGKNYDEVCFACYFVPKVSEQIYNLDGTLLEERPLPYGCANLNTPEELFARGSAQSLREARASAEAVAILCSKCKKKEQKSRPAASWNIP